MKYTIKTKWIELREYILDTIHKWKHNYTYIESCEYRHDIGYRIVLDDNHPHYLFQLIQYDDWEFEIKGRRLEIVIPKTTLLCNIRPYINIALKELKQIYLKEQVNKTIDTINDIIPDTLDILDSAKSIINKLKI